MDQVRILTFDQNCPKLPIIAQGGTASAVVWPGNGARFRTMHHIALGPKGQTVSLRHDGEAVYYVKAGEGQVWDPTKDTSNDLTEGSFVFVEPGTSYKFTASPRGMTLLGGPCPADLSLYQSA